VRIDAPVNFEVAPEPHPTIAMPNPAWRESLYATSAASAPPPQSPALSQAAVEPQAAPAQTPDMAGFELVQKLIQETVVEKIAETIKETIERTAIAALPEKVIARAPAPHIAAPRDEPRDDPAAFAFDPFSHGLQWEPQSVLPEQPAQPPETMQPVQSVPLVQPAPVPHEQPKAASAAIKLATTPPVQKAKPSGPLAPIMALSDEEKIALFS
jgi:hypothetical protein